MSIVLRVHNRKRGNRNLSRPNPYAGRGLDKFARVTEELAAKRESVAARIGTDESPVRFAAVSQGSWVPVFISRNYQGEGHDSVLLRATPAVETPLQTTGASYNAEFMASSVSPQPFNRYGLISARHWACLRVVIICTFVFAVFTTLVASQARGDTAAGITVSLAGAVAMAYGIWTGKWHSQRSPKKEGSFDGNISQQLVEKEHPSLTVVGQDGLEHQSESTKSSIPVVKTDFLQSSLVATDELSEATKSPFHTPTSPLTLSDQQLRVEGLSDLFRLRGHQTSPAVFTNTEKINGQHKHRSRFRSKFFSKHAYKKKAAAGLSGQVFANEVNIISLSAPSTVGSKDLAASAGNLVAPVHVSHAPPVEHSYKKSSGFGSSGIAIGLAINLGGLLAGRIFSLFLIVCWWYLQPEMRRRAGHKRMQKEE